MLTIRACPVTDTPSQLVFLAHDDGSESVFRGWAEDLAVPARIVVTRTDGDAAVVVARLPIVTPTVHICCPDGAAAALELARDAGTAPDLIVVVETGDAAAGIVEVPTGSPVPVPLTVLSVQSAHTSSMTLTVSWAELTSRSVAFRLLTAGKSSLLSAGSPVLTVLRTLVRTLVNDTAIEVEI